MNFHGKVSVLFTIIIINVLLNHRTVLKTTKVYTVFQNERENYKIKTVLCQENFD